MKTTAVAPKSSTSTRTVRARQVKLAIVAPPAPANEVRQEEPMAYEEMGLIEQIRTAFRRENWLAVLVAMAVGCLAPLTGYQVIHHEFDPAQGFMQWSTALAAAVLLFSAPKVYHAGRAMFGSGWQGLALVGILDGTMLWARTPWLIAAALCVQVFFNVVSVGCRLALKKS